MAKLSIIKNYLTSISKDEDSCYGYEGMYQDLIKNHELDPNVFMQKIQE